MSGRFDLPGPGTATAVRFPRILRATLESGLNVWTIPQATVPIAVATLIVPRGAAADPALHPGLASFTGDLLDEGAGARDAIQLGDAFARMGAQLDIDVGADVTTLSVAVLARLFEPCLALLADVVLRPRLEQADFDRVRELRLSRLRQLRQSAGARADRAFVSALFGAHPYGHGSIGTTEALQGFSLELAREFWASAYGPESSTLIVGGHVHPDDVLRAAETAFAGWSGGAVRTPMTPEQPPPPHDRSILLIDRPGAPQSELRIGHVGPQRVTPAYHALVLTNALLGGQFTSRINRILREEKALTYGARTSFDFRRISGAFECDTSVQADGTATAVGDILAAFESVGREGGVPEDELSRAAASLTRGYVRQFETPSQLVRAASQLAIFDLPDTTFDRFVPEIEHLTTADVATYAREFIRAEDATVVVVGDASSCREPLERLGRPLRIVEPEF